MKPTTITVTLLALFWILVLLVLFLDKPEPKRHYSRDEIHEIVQSCIDIHSMEGDLDIDPCLQLGANLTHQQQQ